MKDVLERYFDQRHDDLVRAGLDEAEQHRRMQRSYRLADDLKTGLERWAEKRDAARRARAFE